MPTTVVLARCCHAPCRRRAVILLRRWLDEFAGGGPRYAHSTASGHEAPLPAAASLPLTRRQILDRYEQHTRHCPSCRRVRAVGWAGLG